MVFREARDWLAAAAALLWQASVVCWLGAWHVGAAALGALTPAFLRPRKSLRGQVAVVTGGAGGVGLQLALRLARQLAVVVLWDVDEAALARAAETLRAEGLDARTYVVDVADRRCVYKNAELVRAEVGPVDILVNNAGVVHGRTLLELPDEAIERTYGVNILSHYWTTKSFLGEMISRGRGHVVTVASVAGLMGTYLCTDYSATKFAAVGFHESLLTELRAHGHSHVRTTLVCPYYIDTGMFEGVRPRLMAMLRPEAVAARIVRAIREDEVLVVMPAAARYLLPLKSWLPAELCWALMHRVLRGPQSMSTFSGSRRAVTAAAAAEPTVAA